MPTIQIKDTDRSFDAGKLLCIGRNYARHAAEMGSDVPSEPMVFLKPSSALIASGQSIVLPAQSTSVHHEVELVVLIGKRIKHASAEEAAESIAGYAVGLDMTARDLQADAKKKGAPWSVSKGFDTFAPLGEMVAPSVIDDPQQLQLSLTINGTVRQEGSTAQMIFSVVELVVYCSSIFTLEPGDLIYTGTPEGVGQVQPGDRLQAEVLGLPVLSVDVVAE